MLFLLFFEQARAHGFAHTVIIVGTHLDKIPRHEREQKCRTWLGMLDRYKVDRLSSKGYPIIKHIYFVGCPPLRGKGRPLNLDKLNDIIYNTAMEIESPRG